MKERTRLLYILGPSYSGSTLLTFLIGQHPEVATVGELKAAVTGPVEENHCSCGARWDQCPFWQEVQDRMRTSGAAFSLEHFGTHFGRGSAVFRRLISASVRHPCFAWPSQLALKILPPMRQEWHTIVEQNRRLINVVLKLQGGHVFLDGSKDPERLNQLLEADAWDIKVLRLIRDGRGVTNSYMKHNCVSMTVAAREWVRTEKACDRVLRRVSPASLLTLQYEALCASVEETLAAIWVWAELEPPTPAKMRPLGTMHILGNPMRLGFRNAIKLDQKWRTELCPVDLETFNRIAGSLNRLRGYD